jgi:hypothetical protein
MYCKVEGIWKEIAVIYINTTGIFSFVSVGSGQNSAVCSRYVDRNLDNLTPEQKSCVQNFRLSQRLF